MKESLFVFQKNAISSASVTEDASGTNVDFFAVPASNLTSMSAIENKIVLYFKDSSTFQNSDGSQVAVTLNVREEAESRTTISLWGLALQESKIYVFNDTRKEYAIDTISGIDSILRAPSTAESISISCVDGDASDEEKIRLTDAGGITDDIVIEAGTGMSIARSGDKITLTNTVSGGGIMTLAGAASVDTQTGERFISMSYSTADFSGNTSPMLTPIPLACTLGTACVSIGGASTDAVIKIYKNDSALFTSDSTTWSSAHDRQVFTINSGTYAAGDTLSFSVDQSTSVDMNYVIATITLNVS